jgi:hypothetical protein
MFYYLLYLYKLFKMRPSMSNAQRCTLHAWIWSFLLTRQYFKLTGSVSVCIELNCKALEQTWLWILQKVLWHVYWKPELWSQQRQLLLGNGSENMPTAREPLCKHAIIQEPSLSNVCTQQWRNYGKWCCSSWGRGQFQNPEEGERPPLEAATEQHSEDHDWGH